MFQRFLTKIASHGFLVVAVGAKDFREQQAKTGGSAAAAATAHAERAPRASAPVGRRRDRQAPDPGDRLGHQRRTRAPAARSPARSTPARVAMMGQSCGGLMAIEAAHDPRVDTLVIWNSGVFNTGMASLTTATKATLATIHSNTAYFNGGVSDIAFENSNDDVSRIEQVPVFYGVMKEAGTRRRTRTSTAASSARSAPTGCCGGSRATRRPARCSRAPIAGSARIRVDGAEEADAADGVTRGGTDRRGLSSCWRRRLRRRLDRVRCHRASISAQASPMSLRQLRMDRSRQGRPARCRDDVRQSRRPARRAVHRAAPIDTQGHPFFTPLGSNGRACVTCHQPAHAMSVSAARPARAVARDRRPRSGVRRHRRIQQPEPAAGPGELALAAAQPRPDPRRAAVAAAADRRARGHTRVHHRGRQRSDRRQPRSRPTG